MSIKTVFSAFTVGMSLSAAASSAPIIDQQFLRDIPNNTAVGITTTSIGQTFTVGLTGILTGIDVFIAELLSDPAEGGLTLDVRDASGAVEPSAANALASATIPDASVPEFPAGGDLDFTPIFVDLSAAGLAVTAGDILAFVLTPITAGEIYYAQTDFDGGYSGGTRVSQNGDGNPFGPFIPADLTFTTYVDTIEPSPVPLPPTLVLLGLGVLAMRRKSFA